LVAKAQQIQANRANITSQYLNENRGFAGSLYNDSTSTIGGQRYPAGTSLTDIINGDAKPIGGAAQGGGNAGGAPSGGGNAPTQQPTRAPAAQAVVNQAITAARNGDVKAQAALKSRGISWS
jgi:hypothetical protein